MAEEVKQKVNELTTQTPSLTDFLLGIGASAGSTEYKMLINDLARAIIEQYTGSTVAGSAQSIKAALDALNSKADLAMTRTENDYVDATSFGRMHAQKKGNMLYLNGNLNITQGGTLSDFVEIGRISGWNSTDSCFVTVMRQGGSSQSPLTVQVLTNGIIQIYGISLSTGFHRFSVCVPANS